jgi:hypothetical protein
MSNVIHLTIACQVLLPLIPEKELRNLFQKEFWMLNGTRVRNTIQITMLKKSIFKFWWWISTTPLNLDLALLKIKPEVCSTTSTYSLDCKKFSSILWSWLIIAINLYKLLNHNWREHPNVLFWNPQTQIQPKKIIPFTNHGCYLRTSKILSLRAMRA